jgi:hypothetical protein
MNMQTVQLNISNDIFDKVMSFLEILPKNKIVIVRDNNSEKPQLKKESLGDFFQASPLVGLDLSRSSEVYHDRIAF